MAAPGSIRRSLLLFTGAVIAIVLGSVLLRLTSPSDGARMDQGSNPEPWQVNGVVVFPWQSEPDGLRDGDLVIAVNGQSTESIAENLASPSRWRSLGGEGETVTYTVIRDGSQIDVAVRLRPFPLDAFLARYWSGILAFVIFLLIALFVYVKRPGEPAAIPLLLCALGLFLQLPYSAGLQIGDLFGGVSFWLFKIEDAGYLLFSIAFLHFWLVFPQPRNLVRNHRWLISTIYVAPFTFYLLLCFGLRWRSASTLQWIARTDVAGGLLAFVVFGAALISAIGAYRSVHDPVSRRQVRWVAYAGFITVAALVIWAILQGLDQADLIAWVQPILFILPLPTAVAVAIFRYHLFDIDVIISRTLLWTTLTAFVVGAYVLVVGYVGSLLNLDNNLALSIVATGIVALLFQPLRERVQRLVNRFVYGDRDDPYAVVSRLGQRLEATLAPEAVLPTIVETLAQALKLPYAAISLRQGDTLEIAAAYGTPGRGVVSLPLTYQSESVGELTFAPRAPGDTFTVSDRRLLEDLARQVGIAAHAVRLTSEVQRSRERIVTAREERSAGACAAICTMVSVRPLPVSRSNSMPPATFCRVIRNGSMRSSPN